MKSLLREPLLHFLLLALCLFFLHDAVSHKNSEEDTRKIVVDRSALLNFIQFRTKAFDSKRANQQLAALSVEQLKKITEEFIREEALVREARQLKLDQNDYVIKRRLVQKLNYIAQGFVDSVSEVTEDDIRDYFVKNRDDFQIKPRITFTHVYFGSDRHGNEDAKRLAEETLIKLREQNSSFEDASQFGERFLYGLNFVERSKLLIDNQFGSDMADQLFKLRPSRSIWHGPIQSNAGWHLVMVSQIWPGRLPKLEEVREQVVQQATRVLNEKRAREATQQIVDSYQVDLRYPTLRN